MAIVQFFLALRISEVTAIHYEDLNIAESNPSESSVRICRHVVYPRNKLRKATTEPGYKNDPGGAMSIKELPFFPEVYESLREFVRPGKTGLVFRNRDGSFFSYRQIQHAYNKAFKKAGLAYRSTHVMRHGGCRNVYNRTGDLAIAQQILGNTDLDSTLVYAHRDKTALRQFVKTLWKPSDTDPTPAAAIGRKLRTDTKKPAF